MGMLLPFIARADIERRVVINTIGPVWEGNQVWLILGGGAIFAAWPALYAASFSGFYLAMLMTHGAVYLAMKTEDVLARRARTISRYAALAWVLLFALGGIWIWKGHFGLAITAGAPPGGEPNPLGKTAVLQSGAWLSNYRRWPLTMLVPAIGLAAPLMVAAFAGFRRRLVVFTVSALGIAGVIGTMGVSLFPFLMPSSSHPGSSLTVWDASSSHRTLGIMLIATIIFLPIVLAYTSWIYRVMRGPVTSGYIDANRDTSY
jgi:cytochrome bd ubiquinol oxidase subunit II